MNTIEYCIDDITIIDNFLPYDVFKSIKNKISGNSFNWVISHISDPKICTCEQVFNVQNVHPIYMEGIPGSRSPGVLSPHFKSLYPILEKINPDLLIRIKANVTFNHGLNIGAGYHTDTDLIGKGMTAVMYFDTCNGYTDFLNKDIKVKSLENRICIFPNEWEHDGIRATDVATRMVINFNWLDKRRIENWDEFLQQSQPTT